MNLKVNIETRDADEVENMRNEKRHEKEENPCTIISAKTDDDVTHRRSEFNTTVEGREGECKCVQCAEYDHTCPTGARPGTHLHKIVHFVRTC